MKKNTMLYLVLIGIIAGGILFAKYFHYYFFGYFGSGAAATLVVINYFGHRQLYRAAKRVDKLMKDQKLADDFETDSDNEIILEND